MALIPQGLESIMWQVNFNGFDIYYANPAAEIVINISAVRCLKKRTKIKLFVSNADDVSRKEVISKMILTTRPAGNG